jgi:hypothetical protein
VQGFEHVDAGLNPKIKLFKHCAVPAETFGPVDNFVANNTLQSWLIVDCLSAVRILSGARDTLKETTLVCVCVLTEADFRGEPVGADINNIDSLLFGQGFKRLAFVTGLNPKIGNAIYGRPAEKLSLQELPFIKALNQELLAKVAEIAKLNEDLGNTKAHRYTLAAQLRACKQVKSAHAKQPCSCKPVQQSSRLMLLRLLN